MILKIPEAMSHFVSLTPCKEGCRFVESLGKKTELMASKLRHQERKTFRREIRVKQSNLPISIPSATGRTVISPMIVAVSRGGNQVLCGVPALSRSDQQYDSTH